MRFICVVLTLLTFLSQLSVLAFAAVGVSAKKTAARVIESGVYRIRNVKTGLYIDTYDIIYDRNARAVLAERSDSVSQDIYVERQEDGSYLLTPQSESAQYFFSYAAGTNPGTVITKTKETEKTERFDIYPSGVNYFTISPAYSRNNKVALGALEEKSKYDDIFLGLEKYSSTALSQMWKFEPVETTGISIAYSETTVRLFGVGKLYATLTPYDYGSNKVKWSSDNEKVLMVDSDGSYCALSAGEANVTATCGGYSATCKITVSSATAFTWYSQHNITDSDWNGSALSGIRFSSGGVRKKFAGVGYSNGSDWMDDGCFICANAMVLNNLGATLTNGYDIRSGQSGNLPADPYTVALANSGNNGATSRNAVLYGNPILVNLRNIASRFRVGGRTLYTQTTNRVTPQAIKEALDKHPEGVIVYFSRASRNMTHYIVFTECVNPEAKPSEYRFIVSDSAASDAARGDHVPFEKCLSYTSQGYRLSNAVSIITWNIN